MAVREGWKGRFFEDFEVGNVYEHPLGRTVTTTDNAWFTLLSQNTAPVHFDHNYAAQTEFGKPLVDSTFTLALVTGQRRRHPAAAAWSRAASIKARPIPRPSSMLMMATTSHSPRSRGRTRIMARMVAHPPRSARPLSTPELRCAGNSGS